MSRISTNLNRFYAAVESSFGSVPAIAADNAFRALSVELELVQQYLERRDKSGSRTFGGVVEGGRRNGRFQIESYLMSSGTPGTAPNLGPFYRAACGGSPLAFAGGTAAAGCTTSQVLFSTPHGLAVGQAIGYQGELRFVVAVPDVNTVSVSPPFSAAPGAGAAITGAVTYPLAASLPSLSVFDYWDPVTAQQRIQTGACVDTFDVEVQGDFHTVKFAGEAQDLIDSVTFSAGQGGLSQFPAEPSTRTFLGQPIAGHFGQLWLGAALSRFYTLVRAQLQVGNNIELRKNEVGSAIALGMSPGDRRVTFDFDLFQTDEAATQALYTAARSRTPITAFLQLGASAGHLFAAYIASLAPQVPRNDAGERELKWSFSGARAAGNADDELYVAFG